MRLPWRRRNPPAAAAEEWLVELTEPYRYEVRDPTETDREGAQRLADGLFSPAKLFEPMAIGVPPPWDENPTGNRSWDFHRHGLEWLEPAVRTAAEDRAAGDLVDRVVQDWLAANRKPPGCSAYAWGDHATAVRTRVLLWIAHEARRTGNYPDGLTADIGGALQHHGNFLADDANYTAGSNHGMEMDITLYVLAASMRSKDSARWKRIAQRRLQAYVDGAFSPRGFHREHSPAYHLFVTMRLASTMRFFRVNDLEPPGALQEIVPKAGSAWPLLYRRDGSSAMLGDTPRLVRKPAAFRRRFESFSGEPPCRFAFRAEERGDEAVGRPYLVVDPDAGYILSRLSDEDGERFDLVARCAAFRAPHHHFDAGTFELHARGQDLVVDPGYLNMEEQDPRRQYLRSALAHNVVTVDGQSFGMHPVEVLGPIRTPGLDVVRVVHQLPQARHVRTFRIDAAAGKLTVVDDVLATDGRSHDYRLALNLHPTLVVTHHDRRLAAVGPQGVAMAVEFMGEGFAALVHGEEHPYRGWYSSEYGEWKPTWMASFVASNLRRWTVVTAISVTGVSPGPISQS